MGQSDSSLSCCQNPASVKDSEDRRGAARGDEAANGRASTEVGTVSRGLGDTHLVTDEDDKLRLEKMQKRGKREAISGDAVSAGDAKNYTPPVYPKDEQAINFISDVIKKNEKMQVLLGHLGEATLKEVVMAFKELDAPNGKELIRQGEEGDCLYIMQDGKVDVFVNRPGADGVMPAGRGAKVATLPSGALFGELALMYTAPRAATVVVASPSCKLWVLDREPFKMMLVRASSAQLEMYEGWLKDIDLFKSLNHFELSKLSECMSSDLYDESEAIITQGEVGDKFYILEDGTCAAYIAGQQGEVEVKKYDKQGDYFGELALLNDAPRKATVRATGEGATVLSMSKEDFVNLLGPIQDILRKHAGSYAKYEQYLKK
mmetsp:Transcript_20120/g.36407  ORF Transcript_20120/g.36407 Transcript_20120/m.36407 type:complete len:375 (-) Transcript_20120:82-1206(-)